MHRVMTTNKRAAGAANGRAKLTDEQFAEMRVMLSQGQPLRAIARHFDLTPQAIKYHQRRMMQQIPCSYIYSADEADLPEILRIAAQGAGYRTIARALGVSRMSVYRLCRAAKLCA